MKKRFTDQYQGKQICSNCIMDTSDPTITFDENGVCVYCNNYHSNVLTQWQPGEFDPRIYEIVDQIKKDGANKEHDCLIGISGGLDSSYVAYVAAKLFGLRPLLFHTDAGWNSDTSTSNIEDICESLGVDLHVHVINWQQLKDFHRSFFYSQVPFVDLPQDTVLFAAMYEYATKNKFKYVLTGGNNSTEGVRECLDWTYFAHDSLHNNDIQKQFGTMELTELPMRDIFRYRIVDRLVHSMRVIKILDYVPYIKKDAINTLQTECGWTPYQMKHYESRFTKFFESYWTVEKHGFDKRRVYFSSEILSGQMTRTEALERISQPELSEREMQRDFNFVASKLDFSVDELRAIFEGDNKSFRDYKNRLPLIQLGAKTMQIFGKERRLFR